MISLLDLPLELLHYVLDFLPLSSVYRLGAVCRDLHRLVHQDDDFWRRRVKLQLRLKLLHPDSHWNQTDESCPKNEIIGEYAGLVRDPSLQGNKEFYLLCSQEFQTCLKQARQRHNGRSEFEKLLLHLMPKILSGRSFFDPNFSARCALFGPGIESARTKHLVHRIVTARDNLFEAIEFVSGLPGGFGSGVRIDFKKSYTFELICLYTNSERVREDQLGLNRLLARHNRLLVSDVPPESELPEEFLHENVHKLLPTLDALLFAVDITQDDSEDIEKYSLWKRELEIMLTGMEKRCNKDTSLLVLCCSNETKTQNQQQQQKQPKRMDKLTDLSQHLGLEQVTRPWGIFSVNIANMSGFAKALDWLLYHIQKRRIELEYHSYQGRNSFFSS